MTVWEKSELSPEPQNWRLFMKFFKRGTFEHVFNESPQLKPMTPTSKQELGQEIGQADMFRNCSGAMTHQNKMQARVPNAPPNR